MLKSDSLFYLLGLICGKGYILDDGVSINFPHKNRTVEGIAYCPKCGDLAAKPKGSTDKLLNCKNKKCENFSNKMYDYMDVPRITSEFRNMRWMPGENTCWKKIEGQKKDYEKRYEKYKEYNKKEILNNDDFKMMCDYYEEPIKNLEKIVNRDFSNWLKIENIEC